MHGLNSSSQEPHGLEEETMICSPVLEYPTEEPLLNMAAALGHATIVRLLWDKVPMYLPGVVSVGVTLHFISLLRMNSIRLSENVFEKMLISQLGARSGRLHSTLQWQKGLTRRYSYWLIAAQSFHSRTQMDRSHRILW